MTTTTLELASCWIAAAHQELAAEMRAGKTIATLAAEILADYEDGLSEEEWEGTAGDVDQDDFETALRHVAERAGIAA